MTAKPIIKRTLNKDKVIQAAADLADEVGLEKLSIAAVADRLGVRPPSLYNHVKSLDELYSLLSVKGANDLTDALKNALANSTQDNPVMVMALALRKFAKKNPTLYYSTMRPQNGPNEALSQAGQGLVDLTADAFAELNFIGKRTETAHYFLRCLLAGFVALEASGGLEPAPDVDELFNDVMTLALKAITP